MPCDGKKLVTQLTDPRRDESEFYHVAKELHVNITRVEEVVSRKPAWKSLPRGFYEFFELPKGSDGNPYYAAAMAMVELFPLELCELNFLPHLSFVSILDFKFRILLGQRDERAMLMLLYWYAKICDRRLWWMWKQAWTEGLAVCEYLARAWAWKPELIELLTWPNMTLTNASSKI